MLLTDREWKEFYIKKIFITEAKKKIQIPTGAYVHKDFLKKGHTPRITVTSQNNGVDGYWDSSHKNYRIFKNFISVSFLGTIFYHPYVASLDMKVHCLKLIGRNLNVYISKFLISEIKKSIEDASYGNQLSSTDFPHKKIMLPINDNGEPDYDFMESFVKEQENNKKKEYIDYAKKMVSTLNYKDVEPLEDKQWREFFIEYICDILSGQDIYEVERVIGKMPYTTSTSLNNGIKYFVSNINTTIEANAISVNRNGSVGYSFYHKYMALYSNDCRKLRIKQGRNEFVSLFLTNQITQQKEKYNYGYKMGTGRLKRQKIMLPANKHGNPDYEYMEQYIKNIMFQKYNDYLKYVNAIN